VTELRRSRSNRAESVVADDSGTSRAKRRAVERRARTRRRTIASVVTGALAAAAIAGTVGVMTATAPATAADEVEAQLPAQEYAVGLASGADRADATVSGGIALPETLPGRETDKTQISLMPTQFTSNGRPTQEYISALQAEAHSMAIARGWGEGEFQCLVQLWTGESGWNPLATNSSSGAYGIAQALPADKMAVYGEDWKTNPKTQLAFGIDYIAGRYGTPCAAWGFWNSNNPHWY